MTAASVLEAAFPVGRRGRNRAAGLGPPERQLYLWILRQFAEGHAPSDAATRASARALGLDPAAALTALAREDVVHADEWGRPLVAYPFSAHARGHHVVMAEERSVEAMCALDALGIAPMLGRPVEVVSRDPVSGNRVQVNVEPDGRAEWSPPSAVVLAGAACSTGPSYRICCDVLPFFDSEQSAQSYLANQPQIAAVPIPISQAIELATAIFGDVLADA